MTESKLIFRIQEIPEGKSSRKFALEPGDLDLEGMKLLRADLEVNFEKTARFIDVNFNVQAAMTVTCDRSLEEFEQEVQGHYEVLFKPDAEDAVEGVESKVKRFNRHDLTLNIGQEVRDTILLGLPARKLHPRYLDEEGAPREFETRTFGRKAADEDEEKPVDPRWEALKRLKNE